MAQETNFGAEKLTSRIVEEAEAEAGRIIVEAEAKAGAISSQAEAEAERLNIEYAKKAEKAAADIIERSRTTARWTAARPPSGKSAGCWTRPSSWLKRSFAPWRAKSGKRCSAL